MEAGKRGLKVQRGVTLIEACAVMAIAAILVGSALPSLQESVTKWRFQGAASEVVTEVNFARSVAVNNPDGAWLGYYPTSKGTCALVHSGAKTDCSCAADGQAVCVNAGQALKVTLFPLPVQAAAPMHFNAVNGTVSPTGTIRVEYSPGKELHHKVNIMGRVRSCSPQGAVKGYPVC